MPSITTVKIIEEVAKIVDDGKFWPLILGVARDTASTTKINLHG